MLDFGLSDLIRTYTVVSMVRITVHHMCNFGEFGELQMSVSKVNWKLERAYAWRNMNDRL